MPKSVHAESPLILLIEDETEIAEILQDYFHHEGFRTAHASDCQKGLQLLRRQASALVLLDIRLPGQSGIDFLQVLRQEGNIPVIMLTAITDDLNKLLSLRLGADDYIAKPFNPAEVVARVRNVLRRSGTAAAWTGSVVTVGGLIIDFDRHEVMLEGSHRPLDLTLTEFRLLAHMARQPRRCFSRFDLLEACLPESEALDRVIDSHLSKLRRKLCEEGCGDLIETVRGVGYRLCQNP